MIRILVGDALDRLRTLPDGLARTCVTSPPYYGLRDYGHDGQIGLEPTPDEYVARLVAVFREVRRVLADDGTLWLNIGDSYAATTRGGWGPSKKSSLQGGWPAGERFDPRKCGMGGAKPKDLLGIPWMVAFALRADGWYLRQDIIWHKPNPMPESVTDRCTKAHEYVFLLSKSPTYQFNAKAIAWPAIRAGDTPGGGHKVGRTPAPGGIPFHSNMHKHGKKPVAETANARSVWTVATRPFGEAHFATYPLALIDPMILAGSDPGDTVLDPFAGAGTTLLAARNLDRDAVGIEINPDYAAMARRRVEDMTCDVRVE